MKIVKKRFIAVIPLQEHLKPAHYFAEENSKLEYEKETCFPIVQVIANSVEPLDRIVIELIRIEHPCVRRNLNLLKEELDELCKTIGFEYEFEFINTAYQENIDSHLRLFCDLIEKIQEEEKLYACITYGNKPIPIIINMALEYAYKIKKGIQIERIVYGQMDFTTRKAKLFDTTALFYMNSIVGKLSELNVKQPEEMLRSMLDLK